MGWLKATLVDVRRMFSLGRVGLKVVFNLAIHSLMRRPGRSLRAAILVREAIEELGLTFIKFGQFLALRFDILSPDMCEELQKLFDQVAPLEFDEVRRVIEDEFQRPLEELYLEFTPEAIASASVAQVHSARLRTGERVAVKIQRPGIAAVFEADIRLFLVIATVVDWIMPSGQQTQRQFVLEFRSWTMKETLFTREAGLADRFRLNALPYEIIPRIFWDLTKDKVLTLQFIEGLNFSRVRELYRDGGPALVRDHLPGVDLDLAIHHLAYALLNQLFATGMFHGDPHPGNLIVCADSTIGFVDFGIVGEVTPSQCHLLKNYYASFALGDLDKCTDIHMKLWRASEETDPAAYRREIRMILQGWYDRSTNPLSSIKEMHWGEFAEQSSALVRTHKLQVSMDLVLFFRSIAILHANLLMVSVSMIAEMTAYFQERAIGSPGERVVDALRHWRFPQGGDAQLAPARLSKLLRRLAAAEFQVPARLHESATWRRSSNASAKALVAAILGVSAAILAFGTSNVGSRTFLAGTSIALFAKALVGSRRL